MNGTANLCCFFAFAAWLAPLSRGSNTACHLEYCANNYDTTPSLPPTTTTKQQHANDDTCTVPSSYWELTCSSSDLACCDDTTTKKSGNRQKLANVNDAVRTTGNFIHGTMSSLPVKIAGTLQYAPISVNSRRWSVENRKRDETQKHQEKNKCTRGRR